jgi:protein-disulfide isomerase
VEYANRLRLNIPQFLRDLSQGVHLARINADIESGHQSGVAADPALFINRVRYLDRWSVEQIIAAIVAANDC